MANSDLPLARNAAVSLGDATSAQPRPFIMAALTSSAVGVAAVTLGLITLELFRQLPHDAAPRDRAILLSFAAMFLGPGALYVLLAIWVARRRRWAVLTLLALALLDMALLGALFVTSFGQLIVCGLAALFVITLAVLGAFLLRCLEAVKRQPPPRTI